MGILALAVRDRTGLQAGWTQILLGAVLFGAALALLDWRRVAVSALGAPVLNVVVAINRRHDRHVGL